MDDHIGSDRRNLQPPPPYWTSEKRAKYRNEAAEILRALGEASPAPAAGLKAKIAAYST